MPLCLYSYEKKKDYDPKNMLEAVSKVPYVFHNMGLLISILDVWRPYFKSDITWLSGTKLVHQKMIFS